MITKGACMIKYRERRKYKYTLVENYNYKTTIIPENKIVTEYLELDVDGSLIIKAGYAWDGATKFPDLKTIMRGSLVHDALYQLMREGKLKQSDRDASDRIIEEISIDAGMSKWLTDKVYKAVKLFGKSSASNIPLEAP